MHKAISLKDVVANPFRQMDRYPIKEEKIQSLIASMDVSGFWDNVVAREKDGKYQLAYGHHRWIAFQRKYGKNEKMNLIVRDISDEIMLQMMVHENGEDFGTNSVVEQESIRAVVQAYADGIIELGKPKVLTSKEEKARNSQGIRIAPSFLSTRLTFNELKSQPSIKSYNAESIALFLSGGKVGKAPWWSGDQVSTHIRNPLRALELLEEGLLEPSDTEDLTSDQVNEVARGASSIKRSYEKAAAINDVPEQSEKIKKRGVEKAKQAVKTVKEKLKKAEEKGEKYGTRDIRDDMEKEKNKASSSGILPTIKEFCNKLARQVYKLFGEEDDRWAKINELVKYRDQLDEEERKNITVSLKRVSERCQALIDALNGEKIKLIS